MYRIISYYNRNKKKVWITILIVVFIILILRILNFYAKMKNEEEENKTNTVITDVEDTTSQINHTVISGKNINKTVTNENIKLIDEFILACNNHEVEKAYNMLSNECKEIKYPSLETFSNNYYNNIFTSFKMCDKEAWMNSENYYTYRIVIKDDALSLGKVTYENSFEDFYTIVKTEEGNKLNISSYIGRVYINSSNESNNVKIEAVYKDIYKDYEIYTLNVENNSDKVIKLDSKEGKNTTIIVGENGTVYSSYTNEMEDYYYKNNIEKNDKMEEDIENDIEENDEMEEDIENDIEENDEMEEDIENDFEENNDIKETTNLSKKNIIVGENSSKTIEIKFNKIYNPKRKIIGMSFKDIILDYEKYQAENNKKSYTNRAVINLNL